MIQGTQKCGIDYIIPAKEAWKRKGIPRYSPKRRSYLNSEAVPADMIKTVIALAQSASKRGDVEANLHKHRQFIELAADNGAQVIAFPELSLTGYEPDLAEELAFTQEDERLNSLRLLAAKHGMNVLAGAPFRTEAGIYIATFILYPIREVTVYTKHYLHPGEEKFFMPGRLNPSIQLGKEKIAISVCADMANPVHAEEAARNSSTIYLSNAFITPGGYETDANILQGYARKHSMAVMMVNYSGTSGGFLSAGRTAVWSVDGEPIGELEGNREGILLAIKDAVWLGFNKINVS